MSRHYFFVLTLFFFVVTFNHVQTNVRYWKKQSHQTATEEAHTTMPDETINLGEANDPFKNWDGQYKDWTVIKVDKESKNLQIERDEVLNPCKELCQKLLNAGIILKWRRLDALDMWHENGEPDLEIWIPHDNYIFVLLAEAKKPDGGVHSADQKAYQAKYAPFVNMTYELITSPEQFEYIIRKLSDVKVDMTSFENFQCKPTTEVATDI